MGLFDSLFGGTGETREEIAQRIRNSECGQLFAEIFCRFFSQGSEMVQWLMVNSRKRMYRMETFTNGVQLTKVEVSQQRLDETGTYDVDTEGWSFGASGYEDLPNSKYVKEFTAFLLDSISQNCPAVAVSGTYIKLNESIKKGW